MFRKLVANLPYSPALIADIGFYAKRLKQEEVTRRSAFIFAALAIMIQSLAVFSPPESANASSEQDIIRGGVSSLEDFLARYERNEEDVRDIYTSVGITRDEIEAMKPGVVKVQSDIYVMSRFGQFISTKKEVSMSYPRSSGGTDVRYFSPITSIANKNARFQAWVGTSATLGWFAIIKSSGSLAVKGIPSSINPASADGSSATRSVSVRNLTQNIDGNIFTAKPNDKIVYTIKQTNQSNEAVQAPFSINLTDALEYAILFDSGGGNFNSKTKVLEWPKVDLQPQESQTRSFILQILPDIPVTGVGMSNPSSYDCNINIVFGNNLKTPVDCPPLKGLEGILQNLPSTSAGINIVFAVILLAVIIYFYLRTRQLKAEIRIIRHNFNTGAF